MDRERYVFAISHRHGGGAERAITRFANALADKGCDVHFVQLFLHEDDYTLNDNVVFHHVAQPSVRNKLLRKFSHFMKVGKLLRELKPTFVIPMLETMEYVCFFATRFLRTNLIYAIRNNPKDMPKNPLERCFRNVLCFFSTGVFVQNQKQKEYFPRFMHRRIIVIPNIIGESFLNGNVHEISEICNIVTAGRLNTQKDHKTLIEAFSIVKNRLPERKIQLHIYGVGPEEARLKEYISSLQMEDSVLLRGRSNSLEEVYAQSDLFVLSSIFEGMPNALMEAMAMGLPCISTDCETGPADLIDDKENGMIVPVRDPEAMANAMQFMIEHPNQAKQMGKNAKKTMTERYSATTIAEQFVAECKRIQKYGKR